MQTQSHAKTENPTPLNRQEMWDQLSRSTDMRSSQDQVLWSIFGTFWAANAVLLVALFQSGKLPANHWIGVIVAITGAFLCFTWHILQRRALGHLKRLEAVMDALEKQLSVESTFALSGSINKLGYDEHVGHLRFSARKIMRVCSILTTILWFIGLIFFFLHPDNHV